MTARIAAALAGTLGLLALGVGRSQAAPAKPPAELAPAAPAPAAPPPPPAAAPPLELAAAQREALFDIAFRALTTGDLILAEQAFAQAAALPGDAAYRSVALSFVERVRRARAIAAAQPAPPPASTAGATVPSGTSAGTSAGTPAPARDYSGRVPLLLTTTALGLGAFGWTFPGMLNINFDETPRTFVGFYMVAASGAFVAPYFLTRKAGVTPAEANLVFYGGTRGLYLGVLTAATLAGDVNFDTRYRSFAAGVLLGGIGGAVGGYMFADRQQLTPGQARTTAALGDFGLGAGFGTGFLLGLADSGKTPDTRARGMAASGLLGAAVGLTGGYFLSRQRDNSWGDGEVMRAAGLLGAWSAFAVTYVAETGDKPMVAAVMSGGLLGLAAGDRLVVRTDFTVGQSILVDLACVAGALAAAGTLYLFSPEDWTERPFLITSALGGIAGLGLSYWAMRERSENALAASLSRAVGDTKVALLPLLGGNGERGVSLAGAF